MNNNKQKKNVTLAPFKLNDLEYIGLRPVLVIIQNDGSCTFCEQITLVTNSSSNNVNSTALSVNVPHAIKLNKR